MKIRLTPTPALSVGPPGARDRRNTALTTQMALAIILSTYALLFGTGIFRALIDVGGGIGSEDYTQSYEQSILVQIVAEIALVITLYALICRWLYVPRTLAGLPERRPQALWTGTRPSLPPMLGPAVYTLGFSVAGLVAAGALMNWIVGADPGNSGGGLALNWPSLGLGGWLRSLNAGVVEEIVIVALPVILGRRAGWHPLVIVTLSVAMRIPFHLYHGWASIPWAMIWGGTNVVLFLYLRRLLPLIAVHVANDLIAFYRVTDLGVVIVLLVLLVAVGVFTVRAIKVLRTYERTVTTDGGDRIRYRRVPNGNVYLRDSGRKAASVGEIIDAVRADVGPTNHGAIHIARSRNHPHTRELETAGFTWRRFRAVEIPLSRRPAAALPDVHAAASS